LSFLVLNLSNIDARQHRVPEQGASGEIDFQGLSAFDARERLALPVIIFRILKQLGQILPGGTRIVGVMDRLL
jgi:hypothetical protein